jgi:hypothetical protein
VSFVKLIIKLDDFPLNMKLRETSKDVCTNLTLKSPHNPEKLGKFEERVRGQMMHLHRKSV